MISEICQYFLVLLTTTIVLFFTGAVLYRLFSSSGNSLFFYFVLAIIFYVVLYSIVKTNFQTINAGFILIGIYLVIRGKIKTNFKRGRESLNISVPDFIQLIIVLIFFFLWNLFEHYVPGIGLYALDGDLVYYSKISAYLKYYEIESHNPNVFSIESPTPYHYFELWFNALISSLSGILSLNCFKLVTIPLLQVIVFLGVKNVLSIYPLSSWKRFIIAVLAIFFTGVFPFFANYVPFLAHSSTFLLSGLTPKVISIFIFLIGFIILINKRKQEEAWVVMSCLPLVSIAMAPTVLIATGSYLLLKIVKKSERKTHVFLLLLFLSIGLYILVFYLLTAQKKDTVVAAEITVFEIVSSAIYSKTAINVTVGGVLQMAAIYLVPIIFLALYFRQLKQLVLEYKGTVLWFIFFFVTALLSWGLLHFMMNSVQLFSVPVVCMINILMIVLFGRIVSSQSYKVSLLIFIGFFAYSGFVITKRINEIVNLREIVASSYDPHFFANVREEIKRSGEKGVFIVNTDSLTSIFEKHMNVYWPTDDYLPLISDKYFLTSASFPDIHFSDNIYQRYTEKGLVSSSPYVQYLQAKSDSLDNTKSLIHFIADKNVGFVVAEEGTLNDQLEKFLKPYKAFTNKVTQQKIYFLK